MSAAIQGRSFAAGTLWALLRLAVCRCVSYAVPATVLATPQVAALATVLASCLMLAAAPARAQQANFKPLERGEYSEEEQRLIVAQGLKVGLEYGFVLRKDTNDQLAADDESTAMDQDVRLHLDTVFHTDIRFHLTLTLKPSNIDGDGLREQDNEQHSLDDTLALGVFAREAYLRYEFNPRSGIVLGKQELSLGDRRGKTFLALVPGLTFDCRAGTWCTPMGVARIGASNSDAVTHFALQYTAWEDREEGTTLLNTLQVEVWRLHYQEGNLPLGKNLGPARFNPADPRGEFDGAGDGPHPSQMLQQDLDPIYYDVVDQNFYGLRVTWDFASFFFYGDVETLRGERKYHRYRDPTAGVIGNQEVNDFGFLSQRVRGSTGEMDIGYRWSTGRAGVRYMSASGDEYITPDTPESYARDLRGYHEITPGTYAGSRLYFNGGNSSVELGGGLGHSINNTILWGLFVDYDDPDKRNLGYSFGLYQLSLQKPIPDDLGDLRDNIGIEMDNMLTVYLRKSLKLQLEANGILARGAFRINDYAVPDSKQDDIYQFIGRVVYSF